jgi:organic hydroperoxide reductase OsmC/OhrA
MSPSFLATRPRRSLKYFPPLSEKSPRESFLRRCLLRDGALPGLPFRDSRGTRERRLLRMPTEQPRNEHMADVFISHLEWTGATKGPTRDPATFSRDLNLTVDAITLPMSSAPGYRGDPSRANPEQLFVASLSACQALTYLFLAAKNDVPVIGYTDDAEGRLGIVDGKVRMSRVTLRPRIALEGGANESLARELVAKAHEGCFVANSVSTPVEIAPTFVFTEAPAAAP